MVKNLFLTKPLHLLMKEADDDKHGFKENINRQTTYRIRSWRNHRGWLVCQTAAAAANNAGPSVTLGFIIAGIGCAFAGLCYAEFASMIPISGSAYTYSYATMGNLWPGL